MENLIKQLEATSGPNREIDAVILTTVLGYRDVHGDGALFDRGNDGYWTPDGDDKNMRLPSPTSSLDDAACLVPDGWSFQVERHRENIGNYARVFNDGLVSEPFEIFHGNKPIAIALCIAALKARHNSP